MGPEGLVVQHAPLQRLHQGGHLVLERLRELWDEFRRDMFTLYTGTHLALVVLIFLVVAMLMATWVLM